MNKKYLPAIFSVAMIPTLAACGTADVVAKYSVTSFDAVVKSMDVQTDDMYGGWSLEAPDGTARFILSRDFQTSTPHDIMIETDVKPFVDAGLDIAKLPEGMLVDDKIMVGRDLGENAFPDSAKETALTSFEELLKLNRDAIGYHEKLDHYGIDLGDGNKFEWAKDITKNDKDIVFVLDPKMFIDAGVNPEEVEGWVFGKVEIKDESGKEVEVDKLLKPFDLK